MRQYQGDGQRGPWGGVVDERFQPFERADGTVMTQEEITRVTNGLPAQPPQRQPLSDAALEEVWNLAAEIGQAGAARQLGLTQAGVQYRLEAYMKRNGLTGELPGKQVKPAAEPKIAQVPAALLDGDRAAEAAQQEEKREAQARAARLIAEKAAPASDQQEDPPPSEPAILDVELSSDDVHAVPETVIPRGPFTHFLHGEEWPARPIGSPESAALTPLMDWLEVHGPDWSQNDAERWLKAFTATVDLVYPTWSEV